MINSIADPLVENVVSSDLQGMVSIDSDMRGAVTVTLNHPGNALDGEVAGALRETFETLHAADHVHVVFLRDRSGTFFSGPLAPWMRTASTEWTDANLRDEAMIVAHMLYALTHVPALTVALIEGEASGVGAGLVAACDIAVSAPDARFAFPEVVTGAVPAMAAPYVVNAIGPRQAKSLFMTGRAIDADEALRIGLIQEIAGVGGMDAAIQRLTAEALANGPAAMHEAKRMVWEVWGRPLDRAMMEETAKRFARSRFSEEGRAGLEAAAKGRTPGWAGRQA